MCVCPITCVPLSVSLLVCLSTCMSGCVLACHYALIISLSLSISVRMLKSMSVWPVADTDIQQGATSCGGSRHPATKRKFNMLTCVSRLFLCWGGEIYSQTG